MIWLARLLFAVLISLACALVRPTPGMVEVGEMLADMGVWS